MMWGNSKRFFFLFLLVLVLSSPLSWADVTLTDQEYEELAMLLETSDQEMKQVKQELKESKNELRLLNQELAVLKDILTAQSQLISELKTSSKEPRIEVEIGATYNLQDGPGIYFGIQF